MASRNFDFSIDLEVHATQEEVGSDAKRNSVSDRRFDLNPEHAHFRHWLRTSCKRRL